MKTVIIDSSSAILLYRCGAIPALLKCFLVVIPDAVFSELTVPGHDGADYFSSLCVSGDIKILKTHGIPAEKFSGSLHKGEREVVTLFNECKGDFIIIDDGKGSAFCRNNNIPYINALLAVKILHFKRLINDQEYFDAWRWLIGNGRYSAGIIEWAENADEQKLDFFLR